MKKGVRIGEMPPTPAWPLEPVLVTMVPLLKRGIWVSKGDLHTLVGGRPARLTMALLCPSLEQMAQTPPPWQGSAPPIPRPGSHQVFLSRKGRGQESCMHAKFFSI